MERRHLMSTRRKVVLVTGGTGLVGRSLAREVQRSERQQRDNRAFIFLSSRDGDLTDLAQATRIFQRHSPTHVIHLAAKVGGLYANLADKSGEFYTTNQRLNENVLRLSLECGVERCLSCLSTCIFPDRTEYPISENMIHLGPPHESNRGYAMAKRRLDELNQEINATVRTSEPSRLFFSVIPTNVYGPHDNFHLRDSHVVPGLIHRAYRECINHREAATGSRQVCLNVQGSGRPVRQFVYAPDLARLILWALDEFDDANEPRVILAPDQDAEVSVGRVAELIGLALGERFQLDVRVRFEADRSDGQMRKTASNGKLRRMLPGFEFTPLETGLRETMEWFCAQYPRVRGATD